LKPRLAIAALGTATLLGLAACTRHPVAVQAPPAVAPPAAATRHCSSVAGLPDPACTPGAVRTTDVTSICAGGGTGQFRPPVTYTEPLKKQGILDYGYADTSLASYEEDHLISLELGGDGFDPNNLWPEPHTGNFNSFQKDQVENWLHRQICSGAITVKAAQAGIATNWKQYLPAASRNTPLRSRERE
jgi:hypothetical protein